ncbi:MAG TPA: SctK family type III secretion system sorting platform protein [Rhizobium sp.]|nr:SctK family type III secretion system sorting platform protein [Rhizobium sp.]
MTTASLSEEPAGGGPQDVWTVFQTAPARLVHPRHIVRAYDEAISTETALRLQQSSRVQRPLARLLCEHYRLPPASSCARPSEEDLELLALPREQVDLFCNMAGAVFWGEVLAGEIRSREVAEMKSRIGEDAFRLAIHNRDLAAGRPPPDNLDQLVQAIETDGRNCWASWQAALPEPLAAWLRLRQETEEYAAFSEPDDVGRGAAILRRLAPEKLGGAASKEVP